MLLQSALSIAFLIQLSSSESKFESGCRGPGVFPHPDDCTQFIICAEDHGKTFVTDTVPCPKGYSFSEVQKTCIPSEKGVPVTANRVTRADVQTACKASGPYCEGCDRLVVCANLGERGLMAVANVSCSEIDPDMSCSKASCTTQQTSTEPCEGPQKAGSFRCLQAGFFPDPANCKQFHVCGNDLSHFSDECDDKFDADLGMCTSADAEKKPTVEAAGGTPGPECKSVEKPCTEKNVAPVQLPSYPSYYVICIPVATNNRKSPYVYQLSVGKCPAHQVFNNKATACEFTCSGKRERYQDPDNCRSYTECSGNAAVKKTCPEHFAFHPDRKFCLPETMVQGCQRTRAVAESTTATVTVQATTTSAPTTKQTVLGEGFQCRAVGTFPDASDCRKFITCSRIYRGGTVYFRMRRRQCPFLTYFNPNGFCQFGFCWN